VLVGKICTRNPVIAEDTRSALEAAKLMRQYHVGSLIVVSREPHGIRPVGIITDRDLVIQALAEEVNLNDIILGDVMARDLLIAKENDTMYETIECMSRKGVRRIPVTNSQGYLVGILTMDDMLSLLSLELSSLTSLINLEQITEERIRAAI